MTAGAGVLRSTGSLHATALSLVDLGSTRSVARTGTWEASNLLTVACALVAAATLREETRGCHWRDDFPHAADAWRGHLLAHIDGTEGWAAMA